MRRINLDASENLFGIDTTRRIEREALSRTPAHALMARAGLAVAQLARAIAPHARTIWVACGPGNNGGDGLVAATHLYRWVQATGDRPHIVVTHLTPAAPLPADAAWALDEARAAGVHFADAPPTDFDLAIDALLGIGTSRPAQGAMAEQLTRLQETPATVLCVDLPSGLNADTGRHLLGSRTRPLAGTRHTLSLLTLKPGLFTADGRDQAGTIWLDDLGVASPAASPADAVLYSGQPHAVRAQRAHASHKGTGGDVLVLGGQGIDRSGTGMTGAAVLAARAALHTGAGRVYLGLLDGADAASQTGWDPVCPELMVRTPAALLGEHWPDQAAVVCGCGGGDAVAPLLPVLIERARRLVLDADGLNHVAGDEGLQAALRQRRTLGLTTVLTPHPLEAARLLGTDTATVMSDRLQAARALSERFGAICVLKGSGTVISAPGEPPLINASGNALLASAGTGDVLAGMIGAALAQATPDEPTWLRVADAVWRHGWQADRWLAFCQDTGSTAPLTADRLARGISPA